MTAIEPPRLLEFTWTDQGNDLGFVRWELIAEDGGTHLVLTHTVPESARAFGLPALAGWHSLLDHLAALLDGQPFAPTAGKNCTTTMPGLGVMVMKGNENHDEAHRRDP